MIVAADSTKINPEANGNSDTKTLKVKKKRSKTGKACTNCSKWHVSCEVKRPCSKCIQRGLANTCVDVQRKKSKYLIGVQDKYLESTSISKDASRLLQRLPISAPEQQLRDHPHFPYFMNIDNERNITNRPPNSAMQLDAQANLQAFNNNSPVSAIEQKSNHSSSMNSTSASPQYYPSGQVVQNSQAYEYLPNASIHQFSSSNKNCYNRLLGPMTNEILFSGVNLFASHYPLMPVNNEYNLNFKRVVSLNKESEQGIASSINTTDQTWNPSINQYYLSSKELALPEILSQIKSHGIANCKTDQNSGGYKTLVSLSLNCGSPNESITSNNNIEWEHSLRYSNPIDIYTLISKPFPHTPGFHHLFNYLSKRFSKEKLIIISKELSEFRPIFIASAMTLTEEDMIFIEKCYQRTLLEYSKFIKQIGTPTCIWRRNGQISLVNEEFELLTGWTSKELLNKMAFIVEIMDDDTVIDYFKTFSKIAYKDYKGSETMTYCKILTPLEDSPIACHCVWTLKRDVLGLPLMIVANFMPYLE